MVYLKKKIEDFGKMSPRPAAVDYKLLYPVTNNMKKPFIITLPNVK